MNPKRLSLKIGLAAIIVFVILSFKPEDKKPKFEKFVDPRDNQEYLTVKIGKQWWFAENLNFETDKNSYCRECDTYGRLYRYEAAFSACPEGWHIPSVAEWNTLITYLGGSTIAGGKMKSDQGWRFPEKDDKNTAGFSAIPAPTRGTRGDLRRPTEAIWWTADIAPEPAAWTVSIQDGSSKIEQNGYYRVSWFPVRCIKD